MADSGGGGNKCGYPLVRRLVDYVTASHLGAGSVQCSFPPSAGLLWVSGVGVCRVLHICVCGNSHSLDVAREECGAAHPPYVCLVPKPHICIF